MEEYLQLPVAFLTFWFVEAPLGLIAYFGSVNRAFFHLFSLPLLVKTFFKPIKNEYRKGLVGFSIGMGIAIKSALIAVDIFLLLLLLSIETVLLILFVTFPFLTIAMLFVHPFIL